jgi:hypothetical protein
LQPALASHAVVAVSSHAVAFARHVEHASPSAGSVGVAAHSEAAHWVAQTLGTQTQAWNAFTQTSAAPGFLLSQHSSHAPSSAEALHAPPPGAGGGSVPLVDCVGGVVLPLEELVPPDEEEVPFGFPLEPLDEDVPPGVGSGPLEQANSTTVSDASESDAMSFAVVVWRMTTTSSNGCAISFERRGRVDSAKNTGVVRGAISEIGLVYDLDPRCALADRTSAWM